MDPKLCDRCQKVMDQIAVMSIDMDESGEIIATEWCEACYEERRKWDGYNNFIAE